MFILAEEKLEAELTNKAELQTTVKKLKSYEEFVN